MVDTLPDFIRNWKDSIENGKTPQEIAGGCYHPEALLKGTVWSEVVKGPAEMTRYFEHFTAGKNNPTVNFLTITQSPSGSFAGEYIFKWTDDDGNEQSAEANYTFESAQNDNGENVISLHHSSFFVSGAS